MSSPSSAAGTTVFQNPYEYQKVYRMPVLMNAMPISFDLGWSVGKLT